MYVTVTYDDIFDRWLSDEQLSMLGINPWVLNEGLANGDDKVEVDFELAKRFGIINDS